MTRYYQNYRHVGDLDGTGSLDCYFQTDTGACLTTDGNLAVNVLFDGSGTYDRRVMLFTWPGLSLIDANWIDLSAETDMYANTIMRQGASDEEVVIAWITDPPGGGNESGPVKFAKFDATAGKTAINSWSGAGGNFTKLHGFQWDASADKGWAVLQDQTLTFSSSSAIHTVTSSAVTKTSSYYSPTGFELMAGRDFEYLYAWAHNGSSWRRVLRYNTSTDGITLSSASTYFSPFRRWRPALVGAGLLPEGDGVLFDETTTSPGGDLGDIDDAGSGTRRTVDPFNQPATTANRFLGHPDHSVLGYCDVDALGETMSLYEFYLDEVIPEGGLQLGHLAL